VPSEEDLHQGWWVARDAAYWQRPEIQQEIERLHAEAAELARQDAARVASLERRIEAGVPGAEQALYAELDRQAIETDPPEPTAKEDPEEWQAFFREFYGRDMPLNALYQAELHSIEAAAPPDIGGLAAEYFETNYPQGFDPDELDAEEAGKTVQQLNAEREADDAEDPDVAPDGKQRDDPPLAFIERGQAEDRAREYGSASTRRLRSGAADWPGTVKDGVEAAAARNGAVPRLLKAARRAAERARPFHRRGLTR
jgi:hypothetical protein